MKRIITVFLSIFIACSIFAACTQTDVTTTKGATSGQSTTATTTATTEASNPEFPDYLNLDEALPLVKEGHDISLSIAVSQGANQADAKQIWFWEFARRKMNIDFEVIQTMNAAEYKQLVFASGDLPDILLNLGISYAEQMTYGVGEKMLLPLDTYVSNELTPNLYRLYSETPEYADVIRATDGHIYSLGKISVPGEGAIPRLFFNTRWLADANKEIPTTLDQFIDVLRAFKERGDDIVPMGGGYAYPNPSLAVLNAYGYNTSDAKGLSIALRNGEPVFPFGDKEAYGAYLTTMNLLYSEGLISRDFYTLDLATSRAMMAEDITGFFAEPAYLAVPDSFSEWWAMKPLTSEYNQSPMWPSDQSYVSTGVYSITYNCDHPELAMRFVDWVFESRNNSLFYFGPSVEEKDLHFDMISGWYYDEEKKSEVFVDVEEKKLYESDFLYRQAKIGALPGMGLGFTMWRAAGPRIQKYYLEPGEMKIDLERIYDINHPDMHYRMSVIENLEPYVQDGYPIHVFFDIDTNKAITDLKSIINAHAESETARFITGARPLSEINQYFEEINSLGYQDYLKYYTDYYNNR